MEQTNKQDILVTGGTGFIGSHLIHRLIREGARVHIFARRESLMWRIEDVLSKATLWSGNLIDYDSVQRCIEGSNPEIIFHLAGVTDVRWLDQDWSQVYRSIDINLKGTLNLLKAVKSTGAKTRCFIRTSGIEEYGHGSVPFEEGQRERPVSPYSASQVATTHYCQMLQRHLEFPVVTLRLALSYGPSQSTDFFIPSLITHCLNGQDFEMTTGEQRRDLLYVDDVVEALIRSGEAQQIAGEIINIGAESPVRIVDVAKMISNMTGASTLLKIGTIPERPSETLDLIFDNRRARRLLGWYPTTSLEKGLERTIAWYRENALPKTETQGKMKRPS